MNYKYFKAVSVILSLTSSLVNSESTLNLTDDEPQAVWQPTNDEQLTVNADEGFTIAVNITDCDMDGVQGDFVKISNVIDPVYADDYTELMFTYACVTNLSYFYKSNQITAQYKAINQSSMFRAIFTRVGEEMLSTTTQIPSSTVYLPTPSNTAQAEITVYLYGAKPEVFTNTSQALHSLREVIAEMAVQYTTVNNFPLNGSISSSNVLIQNLEQCHVNWEDYDTCTKLSFSIPINLLKNEENSRWDGYQLNQNHLQLLWDIYAATYIPKTGLQLYPVPNIDGIFKLRFLVAVSIVILFAVAMLVTLRIAVKRINNKRKSIINDQISILDNNSTRPSEISMTEHYLQETPPWQNEIPVFPTSQGFHNSSFEPDINFEEFESESPKLMGQENAFDLVNLDNSDGEEQA